MKVFTVHLRRHGIDPLRDVVLLNEGFSWPAMLFSGLWALRHRLWATAAAIFSVMVIGGAVLAGIGADGLTLGLVGLGAAIGLGMSANDLRRRALARAGFADAGVVCGVDHDAAWLHFMQANPELLGQA